MESGPGGYHVESSRSRPAGSVRRSVLPALSLILGTLILLLSLAGTGAEDGPGSPTAALSTDAAVVQGEMARKMDRDLAALAAEGFAGAVLVAREGTILLHRGYGLADRESGLAVSPRTVFDIGGLGKIFTAAAILRLEADGRLRVDDPVARYVGPLPEDKAGLTLHHLLIHASGLAWREADLDGSARAAFLEGLKEAPVVAPPGQEFAYSESNYILLAAVVERVAKRPFEEYVEEALFRPAGMGSTGFAWQQHWEPGRVAVGYAGQSLEDQRPVARPGDDWSRRGPGGVLTTVGDLYRWIRALEEGTVLPASAREKMLTRYIGNEGYSWHVIPKSTLGRLVRRGGALPAFEASLRWYRDKDLVVIFAVNSNMGFRMKVARILAEAVERHIGDGTPGDPDA